jgi:hypothetical protein
MLKKVNSYITKIKNHKKSNRKNNKRNNKKNQRKNLEIKKTKLMGMVKRKKRNLKRNL